MGFGVGCLIIIAYFWFRAWEADAAERRRIEHKRLLLAIANQPDDDSIGD